MNHEYTLDHVINHLEATAELLQDLEKIHGIQSLPGLLQKPIEILKEMNNQELKKALNDQRFQEESG